MSGWCSDLETLIEIYRSCTQTICITESVPLLIYFHVNSLFLFVLVANVCVTLLG